MKLNIEAHDKWKEILSEINKDQIPVEMMDRVFVNLKDGTVIDIDICELLDEGIDATVIEKQLNSKLEQLDSMIRDIDFHISIDAVIGSVQPATNKTLKNL